MDTALQRIEQWEIENPTLLERERKINSMIADYKLRGFGNCRNVVLLKQERKQIRTKLDDYNRYKNNGCREIYWKKYPGYLFFTDEEFSEIVRRNRLVTSLVNDYTGFVPDSNWKAIQAENIETSDIREDYYNIQIQSTAYNNKSHYNIKATVKEVEHLRNEDREWILAFVARKINMSFSDVEWMLCRTYYEYLENYTDDDKPDVFCGDRINRSGLFIAAPKKQMNIVKKLKEKMFLISAPAPDPDPIVFRYVNGGILVITFWK
jgi:hypothetical protein